MNRNPFTKAPKAKLATAALATSKEWRGRSGETVAQRKARQERAQPDILAQQFRLRGRQPPTPAPERECRSYHSGGPIREAAHLRRRRAWDSGLAHGRIAFRPLGSRLTMRVRKGLRWGHLSLERRLRTALCATNRDGSPRTNDPFSRTPAKAT